MSSNRAMRRSPTVAAEDLAKNRLAKGDSRSMMEPMEHPPGHDETCAVCGLTPLISTARRAQRVIAESASMQEQLKRAARFAPTDAPVVILGETGSGKEVFARVVHTNSARSMRPFVAVNVAALPTELLESELFGHARGAFTGASTARAGLFEAAHGGTLFLDEIGEMPISLQAKLLRALQDGEIRRLGETASFAVDVRIVCATHRDLAEGVRRGTFREDLYYRLKVLTLRVPPLRERRGDILPLAAAFLANEKSQARAFDRRAEARLLAHGWPGNIRELQNAVKHGAALATGAWVRAEDLPDDLGSPSAPTAATSRPFDDGRSLAEVEREHIERVLAACGGAQAEAARVLGIGRNTLWRKLQSYAR
jgi:two-component system response regulator HydG